MDKTLFKVVGTNDIEGLLVAICTTYEKAQKAINILEQNGLTDYEIIETSPVDKITIAGELINL